MQIDPATLSPLVPSLTMCVQSWGWHPGMVQSLPH